MMAQPGAFRSGRLYKKERGIGKVRHFEGAYASILQIQHSACSPAEVVRYSFLKM